MASSDIGDSDGPDRQWEDFDELFVSITKGWNLTELYVDLVVATLYEDHGAGAIEPIGPVTIERKIRLLKRCAAEIALIGGCAELLGELANTLAVHKGIRNTIVHGFPIHVTRHKRGEYPFTAYYFHIIHKSAGPAYEVRAVRPRDWRRLNDNQQSCMVLVLQIVFALKPSFARHLVKPSLNDPQKSLGLLVIEQFGSFPLDQLSRKLVNEARTSLVKDERRQIGST